MAKGQELIDSSRNPRTGGDTGAPGVRAVVFGLGAVFAVAGIALCVLYGPFRSESGGASPTTANVQCGPECLWIATNLLGAPHDKRDFSDIPVDPVRGASLGDLKRAAVSHGFAAETKRFAWNELAGRGGCAILWINRNHFVVAELPASCVDAGCRVRIYDPARAGSAAWWSRVRLESVWSGEFLWISPAPAPSIAAGPRIRMDRFWIDSGLSRERETVFQASVENAGSEEMTLRIANTSCSCTTATFSADRLAPGLSCTLRAAVLTDGKRGPFLEHIRLSTNDPQVPDPVVVLTGTVVFRGNLISVESAHLGNVLPGETLSTELFVHDPGDQSLAVTDVRIESPSEESAQAIEWDIRCDRIESGDHRLGSRGRFFVEAGDYAVSLKGRVPLASAPGNRKVRLLVTTGALAAEDYESELGFTVLEDLASTPPTVILSQAKPERDVQLSSRSNRPVRISQIVAPADAPLEASDAGLIQGQPTIRLRLIAAEPSDFRESTIEVHVNSGEVLRIPVIVLPGHDRSAAGSEK